MNPPPDWLSPEESYLVGLSGGRDSVCLVHWLHAHGFQDMILCHLNHQLRGEEAARDERFVQELSTQLNLPCEIKSQDVANYAEEHKLSLETAARDCRHTFFKECTEKYQCQKILLAHHADDQAETLLFNLLRGSRGLKGMSEQHTIDNLTLLRPLLGIRRAEINDYLAEKQLTYCEDSTNTDKFATRNRFRHEVMPLLQDILDRDPVPALLRAAEHENSLANVIEDLSLLDPQGRLHLPTLRELPPAIQREAIYQYLRRENTPDISSALIERALNLISPDAAPSINLPGGLRLRRRQSRLFISS